MKMNTLLKLITFGLCACISTKYCGQDWVVGPVFGVTAIIWQTGLKNLNRKHLLFLGLSTLIYAAVSKVSSLWEFKSDFANTFVGSFSLAVIFGSVALPFALQAVFPETKKQFKKVVISLVACYFVITGVAYFFTNVLEVKGINFVDIMIVVWQALFLYLFFWRKSASE
ncbi:MAG: hypothetical protein HY582_03390 [Candidatus Omnitrophica bacterium]|nr:hypothetical protein [Candidatus Omnitrophota bacterium]